MAGLEDGRAYGTPKYSAGGIFRHDIPRQKKQGADGITCHPRPQSSFRNERELLTHVTELEGSTFSHSPVVVECHPPHDA